MQNLRLSPMPQICIYIALLWTITADAHYRTWNAALRKPAYQISTNCSAVATRATDGDNVTCSHTEPGGSETWWMVDLLGVYRIEEVHISNIGDNRSDWLYNFTIDVFIKDPRRAARVSAKLRQICYTRNRTSVGTQLLRATCTTSLLGRFVRIIKYNTQPLVLCEVMVWTSKNLERYSTYRQAFDPQVRLPVPFNKTPTSTRIECAILCTEKRDSDNCWGFNWDPKGQLCYFLAPEPLNSSLEGNELEGVHLYVENSLNNNETLDNC